MSKVLKNDCFSYSRRLPEHKSQERDFGQKSRGMVRVWHYREKTYVQKKWKVSYELAKLSDFSWRSVYSEAQAFGGKIKCTFSSLLLSREIDVFVHGSDSWGARDYYAKSNVYVICKV